MCECVRVYSIIPSLLKTDTDQTISKIPALLCRKLFSWNMGPEIVKELSTQKEYFWRGDSKYPSVCNQFKSSKLSASLHNFRKEEEMKSKLPIDIFL